MIGQANIWGQHRDLADNNILNVVGAGAPTNGSSGTGANLCGPGSSYYDTTNQNFYRQCGTLAAPVWIIVNLVDSSSTASGTVQNTEYTLNSVTLPGNFLKAARGFEIRAWGITAANANAKNIKLYLGGTSIVTVTGSTASGKHFLARGYVLRTGASTQSTSGECQVDTATSPTLLNSITAAETDSADIILSLKSANTAAAAASATGYGMIVRPIF
jgi:hypothetical protein